MYLKIILGTESIELSNVVTYEEALQVFELIAKNMSRQNSVKSTVTQPEHAETTHTVTIHFDPDGGGSPSEIIKAIRLLCGVPLKDAKQICHDGFFHITRTNDGDLQNAVREIKDELVRAGAGNIYSTAFVPTKY
jgi:ribosomal protein L7/L12